MAVYMDLRGTTQTSLKIGKNKWDLDASGATALRTLTLGDLPVDLNTGSTNYVLTRGATSITFQPAGAGGGYTYYGSNTTLGGTIDGDVFVDADITGLTSATIIRGNLFVTGSSTFDDDITVFGDVIANGVTLSGNGKTYNFKKNVAASVFQNDSDSGTLNIKGDIVCDAFNSGTVGGFCNIVIGGDVLTGVQASDSATTFYCVSNGASSTIDIGGDLVAKNIISDGGSGGGQYTIKIGGDVISNRNDGSPATWSCVTTTTSSANVVKVDGGINGFQFGGQPTGDTARQGTSITCGSFGGQKYMSGTGANLQGSNAAAGTLDGGDGGSFTCYGHCYGDIDVSGGNADASGKHGGLGGNIEIRGVFDGALIANGGGGDTYGADAGSIICHSHGIARYIRASGGNSTTATIEGSCGEVQLFNGATVKDFLEMLDGTGGGTAPTTTKACFLAGYCTFAALNVVNRAGVTIKGFGVGGSTPAPITLRVDAMSAQTLLTYHDASGNRDIVGAFTDSFYLYSYTDIAWYRVAGT